MTEDIERRIEEILSQVDEVLEIVKLVDTELERVTKIVDAEDDVKELRAELRSAIEDLELNLDELDHQRIVQGAIQAGRKLRLRTSSPVDDCTPT